MPEEKQSRIQLFRKRELQSDERKLIDDVEAYGCHIVQVRPDNEIPGWSYTIGLYEVFGQPEVIVVGLKEDTAHALLNEVCNLYRRGTIFHDGDRQSGLLANVDCEFRAVENRWLEQGVMGYANWFYGDDEYPVLQCVYPDLEGVLPWEDGFDAAWRARQALLFPGAPLSGVEKDFWAAHDPNSSLYDWKFSVPPHTGVYTPKTITNGEEPVLYVTHDASDGAWQFHGASESRIEDAVLICFHHIVDKDPTIKQLVDLPLGWRAWREGVSEPWIREQATPDGHT
jgi:hypothetical protein